MEASEFEDLKLKFKTEDIKNKIDIYTQTEGLSVIQYKELLKLLSKEEFESLEKVMG
ncbi:MAG: hypothetical protein VB120_06985 [Lachnospiraceae bacterium]|nr:hypothetical protein [Lachnospiraceae bacterium]